MKSVLSVIFFLLCGLAHASPLDLAEAVHSPEHFSSESMHDREVILKVMEEQMQRIEDLSKAINTAGSLDDSSIFDLLNERGIAYFFIGEFESALEDFNYVISKAPMQNYKEKSLIGTALWGRLFCHAFKGQLQETCDDSSQIQLLFTGCICCKDQTRTSLLTPISSTKNDFFVLPIAKFANPYERITKGECHDRVAGIADKMYSLAEFVPSYPLRLVVIHTIDYLEDNAHDCCDRGYNWTVCLNPIADAWKKLDDTWDQLLDIFKRGISILDFLTGKGGT